MPHYHVNCSPHNGVYEVHDSTAGACSSLLDASNQLCLGNRANCSDAMKEAKKIYKRSNGCAICCPACHNS